MKKVRPIDISIALAKGIEGVIAVSLARYGYQKTPFKYGYWGREGNYFCYDFVKLSEGGTLLEVMDLGIVHGNARINCGYHRYRLSMPLHSPEDFYLKDTSYLVRSWANVGDGQFDYDPHKRVKFFPLFVTSRVGYVSKKANAEEMQNQADMVTKRWADVLSDFSDLMEEYNRRGQKVVPVDVRNWPEMPLNYEASRKI